MKRSHTRRLWRVENRSVSCFAVVCLLIGLSAVPFWLSDGGAAAYAVPEATQTRESVNTVTVGDGDFSSLRDTLLNAQSGVKTVISLSGNYVAPEGFTHIALPSGSNVEISVPEGSSAVLSRAEGKDSSNGALLMLAANNAASRLTISGEFTYQNSTTLAYVGKGSQLTINGGTYSGNANVSGGVVYADNAEVTINGGTFSDNKATNGGGGAIYLNGGSLSVRNAKFSDNTTAISDLTWSVGGGAIYAFDSNVTLEEGSVFSGNAAHTKSRLGGGGALWVKGNLSINGATFTGNVSDPDGGWHCGGGAIFLSGLAKNGSSDGQTKSTLTIGKATFSGNEAKYVHDKTGSQGDGGAIFVAWNSTMILQGQHGDITFKDNKAARLGGAIYTEEDTVTYMAKAFATSNTAGHFGGGLWLCPSGQGIASKGGSMIAINNRAGTDTDRYANGELHTNPDRKEPTSGAAGDDFAIMSPTKGGISNSYELSNTGWNEDSGKQVVRWYQDGTLTKYTDGLGVDSILDGADSKGLSVADGSRRYAEDAEEHPAGTINSENVSGKKDSSGVAQCAGNTESCVKNVGTALKAVMDSATATKYQSNATVLFAGNHADSSGGAFGTNGAIVFSTPYNAAWRKVDAKDVAQSTRDGNRNTDVKTLAGSQWKLSIKQSQIVSADAQGQKVYMTSNGKPTPYFSADINEANCKVMQDPGSNGLCWTSDGNAADPTWTATIQDNAGYDENPGDGEFSFTNLAGGTFTLTETEAPEGYYRSAKTYTFTTGETSGIPVVKVDGKDALSKSLSGISQIGNDAKPTAIAWNKIDSQSSDKLGGSEWQLLKKTGDSYTVVDGYAKITDCASGNCENSEDKDTSEGGFRLDGLAAGEYRLKETGMPTGYDDSETAKDKTYSFVIPDPASRTETPDVNNVTLVDGMYVVLMKGSDGQSLFNDSDKTNVIGNERKTGSVAWNKVSAKDNDKKLSGSEWQLEIKSGGNWIPLSYNAAAEGSVKWLQPADSDAPTAIIDCESEGCEGADAEAGAGEFRLAGLGWGTYRLIETKAPDGFVLPDKNVTWYEFTIDADHTGKTAIALQASGEKGSNAKELLTPSVSDGQGQKPNTIANVAVVVQLPFTGGMTDRAWLLGGLALCALAALGSKLRKRMTDGIRQWAPSIKRTN